MTTMTDFHVVYSSEDLMAQELQVPDDFASTFMWYGILPDFSDAEVVTVRTAYKRYLKSVRYNIGYGKFQATPLSAAMFKSVNASRISHSVKEAQAIFESDIRKMIEIHSTHLEQLKLVESTFK